MTSHIGASGRQARDLALDRVRRQLPHRPAGGLLVPARSGPLPLVQRVESDSSAEAAEGQGDSSPASDQEPTAVERETSAPSPEEVADRVYDLFRQEMRLGRERERPLVS
jgi:hypothetical protein